MSSIKEFEHLKIQLQDIKSATNDFADDNCIGKGGFGKVYKGELVHSKGLCMVAVKRLNRVFGQGDPEFWKEIMMLSCYKHENIVSLLGFCNESDERILVYDYVSKRSLDLYLNNDDLTWVRRIKICIGAARGLAYLHNPAGTQQRVLHRDIKSSNILIDENWDAKISDLGLSKFGPANQQYSFIVSNPAGTMGYWDPIYVETGLLTKEVDVYSLGVVLFEVLCGRLCIDNNDKHRPLTKLVQECYQHNKINEIIYGNIKDQIDPNSLKVFTTIAYRCLKRNREDRPLMTEIVEALETALEYQESSSGSTPPPNIYSPDDLPKTVVRTLYQGSNVMCMDFHPQQQTILLVGTNVGEISIWEVGSRERMVHKTFKVWDTSACSILCQITLIKDAAVSVNRCIWGPDGSILGVAFSKHIVQIYTYNPSGELRQHIEIDAHVGGVNDIAFAHPNKQLCIVTCGDDKTIKVWDAVAGQRQYTFEGHETAVYSICANCEENIQYILSTTIDGKFKAWLYDGLGSRVDSDHPPGLLCSTTAYSADGTRLFSCGTSKEGEAHLVEWNESEGAIKREYSGFRKRSMGVVQFDTTRNRFLAAGDEFQIKFWDMDSTNMLTVTDADDGLPARPRLRFNKEGSLLAVTTSNNGIKVLANSDGQRMLRMLGSRTSGFRAFSDTVKPSIPGPSSPIPNVSSSMASVIERDRKQTP